jgi:cytochrome o ubiquinol oxidase subunit III
MNSNVQHLPFPDPHQDVFSKNVFGFWVYLMTDCLIFATLFTTYAVLHHSTFDGPTSKQLFDLNTTIAETAVLLVSSVTCGLGMLAAVRSKRNQTLFWMSIAFLLGLSFVIMEALEFRDMAVQGHSWRESAFLSSYFTLVGTHGLHVSIGLLWLLVLMGQLVFFGLTTHTFRRLVCFSMFWHFLDLVWIFIFTFVYLMGVK